ncbi:preprotein translocase subunit YajC [Bengtsoniella intestinalis]|uniref:preprotein translocase subunit YajC n=1 Tax=Bengtsoniella intestinalis TaxID=3073143 RepID=UPI00391F525A
MDSVLMIVLMFAVFYFMLIRPEKKRKQQAENMRNSLKKNDKISTIGGIIGTVVAVNEATIVIETSDDRVRIELAKWAVGVNETQAAAAAASNTKKPMFGKKAPKEEVPAAEESTSAEDLTKDIEG